MMRKTHNLTVLGIILCLLAVLACGCGPTLGETTAEANRRRLRNARIYQRELMDDIDKFLLIDRPSALTDMRIH